MTVVFVLQGLNTEVSLTTKVEYPDVPDYSFQQSYLLQVNIDRTELDNIFYFKDISSNTLDMDNSLYYCDSSNWPTILYSEGVINNDIKQDIESYEQRTSTKLFGPSWLAKNITGGFNNSDIFNNEDELVQQYVTLDNIENGNGIKQKLITALNNGGSSDTPKTNNDKLTDNIAREIVNNMINSETTGVVQRVRDSIDGATSVDDWIPVAFENGDIIEFQLVYNVDSISSDTGVALDSAGNSLGLNVIEDQDYRVRITIRDATLTSWLATAYTGYYEINNEQNPTLNATVGDTVRIELEVAALSHPLAITSALNADSESILSGPVTGGAVQFVPDTTGTYYYLCTTHYGSGMYGEIIVS